MSAPDSEPEQAGKRDSSTGMKPKLEQDEEGWAILPAMGNYSLEDCKHIIRDYITQIYSKPPSTWMEIYTGLTLDPVQNVIGEPKGSCALERDGQISQDFLQGGRSPKGFQLLDPSHLFQEDLLTLWEFLTSHQKDGQVGLMFSGCDP